MAHEFINILTLESVLEGFKPCWLDIPLSVNLNSCRCDLFKSAKSRNIEQIEIKFLTQKSIATPLEQCFFTYAILYLKDSLMISWSLAGYKLALNILQL